MRKLLVGAAECKGAPIHYYLLVETLENGVETYGCLLYTSGAVGLIFQGVVYKHQTAVGRHVL